MHNQYIWLTMKGATPLNYVKTEFRSEALHCQVVMDMLIPQGPAPEHGWPILYLLHGFGESNSHWMRFTQLEHLVQYDAKIPLAIVMPNVSNSFYTDSAYGNYWTYVSEEIPEHINQLFHIDNRRENTFVAGFSMGGFGAFKLALNKPNHFAAAYSISGALDNLMKPMTIGEDALAGRRELLFGAEQNFKGSVNDLETLSQSLGSNKNPTPELAMYCGDQDFLIDFNRSFHTFLTINNIPHTYIESEREGHTHRFANVVLLEILKDIKQKIII